MLVGAVDLVDQQDRGPGTGMLQCAQQRPFDEIVAAEQVVGAQRVAGRLGEPDGQQLAWIVPLVDGFGDVEALVALQPDDRQPEPQYPPWQSRSGCAEPAPKPPSIRRKPCPADVVPGACRARDWVGGRRDVGRASEQPVCPVMIAVTTITCAAF
jgi:hypothetical protein